MYVVLSIRAYVENMDQAKLLFLIAICMFPRLFLMSFKHRPRLFIKNSVAHGRVFYYFIWRPRYVGPVSLNVNVNLFALEVLFNLRSAADVLLSTD